MKQCAELGAAFQLQCQFLVVVHGRWRGIFWATLLFERLDTENPPIRTLHCIVPVAMDGLAELKSGMRREQSFRIQKGGSVCTKRERDHRIAVVDPGGNDISIWGQRPRTTRAGLSSH